jgi:hypothetical protein
MTELERPKNQASTIAIFPFLKTAAPILIGNLVFRSTEDVGDISPEDAQSLSEIPEMLFLQDDLRIEAASYAVLPWIDLDLPNPDLEKLKRIRAVIAYCYAIPHHIFGTPHLHTENASLIVFSPAQVFAGLVHPDYHVKPQSDRRLLPDERGEVRGYHGLYNFKHHFWAAKGSRLYPPVPDITLNIAQDLANDVAEFSASRRFHMLPQLTDTNAVGGMVERALIGIAWFNEAHALATEEGAAIVNLAIAFESLLGLPPEEKTERLVDSIALLLGRIPRLDEWARQFYEARSRIVHEGKTTRLWFSVVKSKKPPDDTLYGSLLSYGGHIFQLCTATLLFGAGLAQQIRLEDKFVTNRERFEQMSRTLSDNTLSALERLQSIAEKVDVAAQYSSVTESPFPIKIILDVLRLAAKNLLECGVAIEAEAKRVAEKLISASQSAELGDALEAVREFHDFVKTKQLHGDPRSPWIVTVRLVDVGWDYLMWHHFSQRRKQRQEAADDAPTEGTAGSSPGFQPDSE